MFGKDRKIWVMISVGKFSRDIVGRRLTISNFFSLDSKVAPITFLSPSCLKLLLFKASLLLFSHTLSLSLRNWKLAPDSNSKPSGGEKEG